MKFSADLIREAVLEGTVNETHEDITLVEKGQWCSDGKYENAVYVFLFNKRHYRVIDNRTGSYYSEYWYESDEWEDVIDCDEVERIEVVTHVWRRV